MVDVGCHKSTTFCRDDVNKITGMNKAGEAERELQSEHGRANKV